MGTMVSRALKRWLFLTHRWLGIGSCLLFAVWFVSGLIMVYIPYPSLKGDEWLAGQAPVDWGRVAIDPQAARRLAGDTVPRQLALEMRGAEPVWRVQTWQGVEQVFSAVTGLPLGPAEEAEARAIAEGSTGLPVERMEQVWNDQWTIAERYDRHRPLWKARIRAPDAPWIYISSTTGRVVLDTTAWERGWNWIGTVPHWIYFTTLREHQTVWRQAVIWLSGPATVAAIAGLWLGVLRMRLGRRRYKAGRVTPYAGWMKWHHLTGLAGGFLLILWIFSGWLSVDPGHFFAGKGPSPARQMAFVGALPPPAPLHELARAAGDARRVVFSSAAGYGLARVEWAVGETLLLDAVTLTPTKGGGERALDRLSLLYPSTGATGSTLVTQPDSYWYALHGERPLPVLRVYLDDEAGTWLHIHPATGELLGTLDRKGRLYRWMFDLPHLWDAPFLLERPLLREMWIWFFSLLGLAVSVTGVWIGWRRLFR